MRQVQPTRSRGVVVSIEVARHRGLQGLLAGMLGIGGWLVIPQEAAQMLAAGLVVVSLAVFEALSRRLRLLVRELRRRLSRVDQ